MLQPLHSVLSATQVRYQQPQLYKADSPCCWGSSASQQSKLHTLPAASSILGAKDIFQVCRTIVGQPACTSIQWACNALPGTPSAWYLEITGFLYSPGQTVCAVLLDQHSALVDAQQPSLHCLAGLHWVCLCQLAQQALWALPASEQTLYKSSGISTQSCGNKLKSL